MGPRTGSHEPVLQVASGDTIRTWCVDSGGFDRNGEEITDGGNPQTGPFYVEGAEPGDTLSVRFDRIRPNPRQPRQIMDQSELDSLAASIREHGVLQCMVDGHPINRLDELLPWNWKSAKAVKI